jgi:phosphohistidine phosphatase
LKKLVVLRHAKTEPGGGATRDIDRVLLERGRRDAAAMAKYFKAHGHGCDAVLCSNAARTRETLSIFQPIACAGAPVEVRSDLYLAEASEILALLRELEDDVNSVLIVCHNPGAAELVQMMCLPPRNDGEEDRHKRMRAKFSTCSLAVIDLDIDLWQDARKQKGVLADFMRPRDLGLKES